MNLAESAAFARTLDAYGFSEAPSSTAGLIVINTCSVRITAETRVYGRLAHYAAQKKLRDFKLLVTGCMASRLGTELCALGADFVVGTEEKERFEEIIISLLAVQSPPRSVTGRGFFAPSHYQEGAFRSMVPIMHGCNNFCSYCIVPYVRGPEISRPPLEIKREIESLAEKGVCEITLLGQNVNSYSHSDGTGFPELLELAAKCSQNTGIRRIRFLSAHPAFFSPRTVAVLRDNPVFCRYIHLCVQSGSDRVLSAMNRRYTRASYMELVLALRSAIPGLSLSTDILVGFPGETESEFEETLSLMNEVRFIHAYMYHYNPREGTAAYSLPGRIDDEIRLNRLERVIALQQTHTAELLQTRLGAHEEVLAEGPSKKNPEEILCRTERDEPVVISGSPREAGSFIRIKITSVTGNTLRAERA